MTTYCIAWQLKEKYDPERTIHHGPGLYKRNKDGEIVPKTLQEAQKLCSKVNNFARRGDHFIEEFLIAEMEAQDVPEETEFEPTTDY